ncbi:DUF6528 family protein [Spirillospora sp. NPDC048911]|uniref:DUF6528 family protein n=1 Tax=Spirillospora sp. NPDC048911 TaxID=3364527 RepID=UPI00371D258B
MLRRAFLAVSAGVLATAVQVAPALAAPTPPPGPGPQTDPLPDRFRSKLAAPPVTATGRARGLVIGGDQGAHRIWVMDAGRRDWTPGADPRAVRWSWAPTEEAGFGDVLAGWGAVSDVRVRTAGRRTYVLAGDSWGYVGAVEYPSGKRLWAVNAGRPSNVHAAELLPDGNVAAAASTGGWVRVYAASQGPAAAAYTEFKLKGGHGVLWDPRRRSLWAIGDDDLVELKVGGTASAPTLTEARRVALPTQGGHDLAPVYADRGRLWVTTNFGVYQFHKRSGTFETDYRYAPSVNLPIIKSVGDNPVTRQVLLTRPKVGCATTWCTDTVELFGRTSWNATRTLTGAQFYKARWFTPRYQ